MSTINYLESIDSGSNYRFGNKMEIAKLPRSLFDLSHLVTTDIPKEGIVYPLTIIPTNPAEDFDINADCLLRVMPQVVPLYSRMRMYIYGFYSRMTDLWDEADVFITRGYNGNETSLRIPTLNNSNIRNRYSSTEGNEDNILTEPANSLWDYMGLPQGISRFNSTPDSTGLFNISDSIANAKINALPFMMYLRIWRDYFINKNHYINDRVILPNDDSRFRLNSNGELLSAKDQSKYLKFSLNRSTPTFGYTESNTVFNFGLFTHLWPSDYFTSALPFTQRGTPTPLQANVTNLGINSTIDFSAATFTGSSSQVDIYNKVIGWNSQLGKLGIISPSTEDYNSSLNIINSENFGKGTITESTEGMTPTFMKVGHNPDLTFDSSLANTLNKAVIANTITGNAAISVYANDIRKLFAEQQELEKMARTDGSLGGFGLTFFGERSKNARDYKPTYLGGTYKNISFTEVLQTSGSSIGTTDPESSSPLGAQAGHGIVGISNGRIGHCHSDDYGYIMLLACIMPDVYYHQGLSKMWTIQRQDELYLPERARLGLVPILNKELYFAGNNSNSPGGDNYLWAYQNPFDEFRYMPNKICGKMADPTSKSFYPYTQARTFTQLPNWGSSFSVANNIRDDYLFAPNESHFTAQFQFNIRAVRPIPYKPIPAKLV